MRTRLFVVSAFFVLCATCVLCRAASPPAVDDKDAEDALVGRLLEGLEPGKALEEVLEKPENHSAHVLVVGAVVAWREERLEDSAFLFHASKLRASFDEACFPPKGKGGDDPFLAYAAVCQLISSEVNSSVIDKPKVFAKALARVEKWSPRAPSGYNPGYEHTTRKTEEEARKAVKAHREEYLKGLNGICTLLNNEEYFKAFKVFQAYNIGRPKDRPTNEAKKKATKTMKRIEKETGLEGFATMSEAAEKKNKRAEARPATILTPLRKAS